MKAFALADFGSTFTKVTLVEQGSGEIAGRAQAPTTVGTDVMEGYDAALLLARESARGAIEVAGAVAASSAGGGLRMAAVGLVPELTAAAARQAALNAGAKVELVLSGRLDSADADRLAALDPEILLFSGGTDDGQERLVLENAEAVAGAGLDCHVVVACNRAIAGRVARLLRPSGRNVDVVGNVLPAIDVLDVEPARHAIHEAFVRHVIRGKALSRGDAFERMVAMPTPEAVLEGTALLARAAEAQDVVVVDVGGATTDVHSAIRERPTAPWVTATGLPTLPVSRSVQGDLGVRWSAANVHAADADWLAEAAPGVDLAPACAARHADPGHIPADDRGRRVDRLLATSCIALALRRHCGRLVTVFRAGQGIELLQEGLDLRDVQLVVGTGGILVHDAAGPDTLAAAVERREPHSLTPRNPRLLIDGDYVLSAAGLLATRDPKAATRLLTAHVLGG